MWWLYMIAIEIKQYNMKCHPVIMFYVVLLKSMKLKTKVMCTVEPQPIHFRLKGPCTFCISVRGCHGRDRMGVVSSNPAKAKCTQYNIM